MPLVALLDMPQVSRAFGSMVSGSFGIFTDFSEAEDQEHAYKSANVPTSYGYPLLWQLLCETF